MTYTYCLSRRFYDKHRILDSYGILYFLFVNVKYFIKLNRFKFREFSRGIIVFVNYPESRHSYNVIVEFRFYLQLKFLFGTRSVQIDRILNEIIIHVHQKHIFDIVTVSILQ